MVRKSDINPIGSPISVACAEIELVKSCIEGDDVALRDFVGRFQGMIFGLCFRMLGHRQDAEDVSQDAFLRVFRNLHRWDRVGPLKPWLMTIAANRCRTALERRTRRPRPSDLSYDVATEFDSARSSELAEELQLALSGLRDEYRTCFVLFYHQELSCAEISAVLDCPQGTVKTWLHRARHELAERLRQRDVTPEASHEMR